MNNLTSVLLPRINAFRVEGLNMGEHLIHPHYDALSLANIPASICDWLGIPGMGGPTLAPEIMAQHGRVFRHVILLVIDGMGLNTFQSALETAESHPDFTVWHDFDGLAPLTSIVPSTTAAALTTLWTGTPPAQHGIMAYEVWLKEYGLVANMIRHAPVGYSWEPGSLAKSGFDPLAFLPVPTLGPHLVRHGIQASAFQHFAIANSGLSTMLMPEVDIHPYRSLSDLWVSLDAHLAARSSQPAYTYIYWGDLDEHSHRFGPGDPRTEMEFAGFSRQFGSFLRKQRSRPSLQDTLLLVTADHGHLSTPSHPQYELRNHPELRDCLVMYPSGEARLPFVYLRPGREAAFLKYIETTWPGEFAAIPSAQVLQSGLFGGPPFYPRASSRVGDFVIVPQNDAYWYFGDSDNHLLGRHGGMSRTEMLVPLLSMVL